MNEKQNIDIENKVSAKLADMKRDMFFAIKEVSDRQDDLEDDQKDLRDRLMELQAKVNEMDEIIKSEVQNSTARKPYAAIVASTRSTEACLQTYSSDQAVQRQDLYSPLSAAAIDENQKIQLTADLSRRTFGFKPFEQSDIEAEII